MPRYGSYEDQWPEWRRERSSGERASRRDEPGWRDEEPRRDERWTGAGRGTAREEWGRGGEEARRHEWRGGGDWPEWRGRDDWRRADEWRARDASRARADRRDDWRSREDRSPWDERRGGYREDEGGGRWQGIAAEDRDPMRTRGLIEREDRGPLERLGEAVARRLGRGPKGYRRSDDRVREEVCERIARSGIDAGEVEVKVEDGEVTLEGSVARREEKRWLEDVAEDVFGVDQVHNRLRVARTPATSSGAAHEGDAGFTGRHDA
jgi:hypothetical protein